MHSATATVDLRAGSIPMREELTRRYQQLGLSPAGTIGGLLWRCARAWPTRPAVRDVTGERTREVTYAELFRRAGLLASQLRRGGFPTPGGRALVQAPNSLESLVAFWAVWHLGGVCIPVVDIYRQHEVGQILDAVHPDAILTVADHRGHSFPAMYDELLGERRARPLRILLEGEAGGWQPRSQSADGGGLGTPRGVGIDAPALVLFTSGTTAEPKGVVHSSRTLIADARQVGDSYGVSWRDRSYIALPVAHITGILFALTIPALTGAAVVLSRVSGLEQVAGEIVEHEATWANGPARIIDKLAAAYVHAGVERCPLKAFPCGGGMAAQRELVERADEFGIPAFRSYGMSECPTVTTSSILNTVRQRFDTDGMLAPGVDCTAVDPESREPLPAGSVGELRVRGPERMLGYLRADQSRAQIDGDGWFYTGDLGCVDEELCVTISGRIKDIINRGGEKFPASDIESVLISHPDVADAAVVAAPDSRYGEVPAAFLVPRPGAERAAPAAIATHLASRGLARQKVPAVWEWLPELPRTATGKVIKRELLARLAEEGRPRAEGAGEHDA